ncbi:MAG: phospholipase, partial [Thermoproteota archaeon]|nr:phospholipase [Thermoproteota archaeon]
MNRLVTLLISIAVVSSLLSSGTLASVKAATAVDSTPSTNTKTPIKHVVVLFQENVSFDHYFGTYPNATNPPGEPKFTAAPNTPSANGPNAALLSNNPNGNHSINPVRLDRSKAITCDMNHEYT